MHVLIRKPSRGHLLPQPAGLAESVWCKRAFYKSTISTRPVSKGLHRIL